MLRTQYFRVDRATFLRKQLKKTTFFTSIRLQSTKTSNPELNKKNNLTEILLEHESIGQQLKKLKNELRETSAASSEQSSSLSVLEEKLRELQSKPVDFHYYLRSLHKIQKGDKLPYKFGMNQLHTAAREESTMDDVLRGIVQRFEAPVSYAFGYGSKVFSQGSSIDISNSQIDMILAVSDPLEWHRQNIARHGSDYSFLKYLGPSAINYVSSLGAGIYFNPFVDVNINGTPLELKYGVLSVDTLIDDLANWSTMYLAGRLHKPVAIVQNSAQLLFLNQFNLANAVKFSALLLNKQTIKESELYLSIAGLSYMGDPRLKVQGENPDKVKNIVENQFSLFKSLYKPILDNYFPELIQSAGETSESSDRVYHVNLSEEQIAQILIELPRKFRSRLFNMLKENYGNELSRDLLVQEMISNPSLKVLTTKPTSEEPAISYNDIRGVTAASSASLLSDIPKREWEYLPTEYKVQVSPFIKKMASDLKRHPDLLHFALSQTVEDTVGSSALVQSVKGILTAGVVRSWKYALAKRRKYLQARANKQN